MALTDPRPSPPANTLRAAVSGIYGASRWANVFWVRNGTGTTPSDADLNTFALAIYNHYTSNFKGLIGATGVIEGCQVIFYGGGGLQIGGGHVANTPCTRAGGSLPASSSCCISWHVQQRYRGGHPRTYLPPAVPEDLASSQKWSTAYTGAVRTAAGNFLQGVNGTAVGALSDCHLGTVSFQLKGDWRATPVFRDFTPGATTVDERIDTQRRRLGPDL